MNRLRLIPFLSFLFFTAVAFAQIPKGGQAFTKIYGDDQLSTIQSKTKINHQLAIVNSFVQPPEPLYAMAEHHQLPLHNLAYQKDWDNHASTWFFKIENPFQERLQMLLKAKNFPKTARIFIADESLSSIAGAFDYTSFSKESRLLTPAISAKTVYIMVDFPQKVSADFELTLQTIYRSQTIPKYPNLDQNTARVDTGFGTSYPCHININCPEGDAYQDEKRGVVRVHMVLEEGLGWCSGSLINNTAQDEIPYILTAFHCQDGYTPFYDLWRFDFEYEGELCANPSQEPNKFSNTGCTFRAGRQESDFLLLQMEDPAPSAANAYFLGWDRNNDYIPSSAAIVHHPAGDIKKISREMELITIFPNQINWSSGVTTPPMHHYRCNLDEGTHQGGSSGSPFMDGQGRIIGQLHGGITDTSDCTLAIAYFGRFQLSWDEGTTAQNRLMDWLDPLGEDPVQFDGMEASSVQLVDIQGIVQTGDVQSLANVKVSLSGDMNAVVYSDGNGGFNFENVPADGEYSLSFEKQESAGAGVSGVDMVLVINHLLGFNPFTNIYAILAADGSGDDNISGLDLVQMRNVILGLWTEFPNKDAWNFYPPTISLDDQSNYSETLQITGVKTGDVNFSVDPGN